jgi:hypothetical protein
MAHGTEVRLRSKTTVTGVAQGGGHELWEVICWDCGDAWDGAPDDLSPELRALRGPWSSKSIAEERRDSHRLTRHAVDTTAPGQL